MTAVQTQYNTWMARKKYFIPYAKDIDDNDDVFTFNNTLIYQGHLCQKTNATKMEPAAKLHFVFTTRKMTNGIMDWFFH